MGKKIPDQHKALHAFLSSWMPNFVNTVLHCTVPFCCITMVVHSSSLPIPKKPLSRMQDSYIQVCQSEWTAILCMVIKVACNIPCGLLNLPQHFILQTKLPYIHQPHLQYYLYLNLLVGKLSGVYIVNGNQDWSKFITLGIGDTHLAIHCISIPFAHI